MRLGVAFSAVTANPTLGCGGEKSAAPSLVHLSELLFLAHPSGPGVAHGRRRDKHRLAGPAEAAGPAAGWRRHSAVQTDGGRARNAGWRSARTRRGARE